MFKLQFLFVLMTHLFTLATRVHNYPNLMYLAGSYCLLKGYSILQYTHSEITARAVASLLLFAIYSGFLYKGKAEQL